MRFTTYCYVVAVSIGRLEVSIPPSHVFAPGDQCFGSKRPSEAVRARVLSFESFFDVGTGSGHLSLERVDSQFKEDAERDLPF